MYIEKIMPFIDYYLVPLEKLEKDLRRELSKIYFEDMVDEFIFTYLGQDLSLLRDSYKTAQSMLKLKTFPRRPFVKYPPEKEIVRTPLEMMMRL